jgi:hypothetical protein
MIRHGVPITESATADLTVVVSSRETALLEYLPGRARTRVVQVLMHSVRSEGFRDGLNNAAALQRPPWSGPVATVADGGTTATRSRGGAETA